MSAHDRATSESIAASSSSTSDAAIPVSQQHQAAHQRWYCCYSSDKTMHRSVSLTPGLSGAVSYHACYSLTMSVTR
eukprot:9939-Heterococcus_DN1.PRE.5